MKNIIKILALLTLTSISVIGQENGPFEKTSKIVTGKGEAVGVQTVVHAYQVETSDYVKLMKKKRASKDFSQLENDLHNLMANGKSKLVSAASSFTRPGAFAANVSGQADNYATDYLPASSLYLTKDRPQGEVKHTVSTIQPLPTSFEERQTGTNLEVESTILPDQPEVSLTLDLKLVSKGKDSEWPSAAPSEKIAPAKMPTFHSMNFKTSLWILSGKPHLVGICSPQGEDGKIDPSKKIIVLVTATVLKN